MTDYPVAPERVARGGRPSSPYGNEQRCSGRGAQLSGREFTCTQILHRQIFVTY
jgi:hypothetical protein